MTTRWSTHFLRLMTAGVVLLGITAAHAGYRGRALRHETALRSSMVAELGLSDLCLFTEARYTRNPSVADRNSAFQDHPLSLEHFPSGSLMPPPEHLVKGGITHGAP